MSEPRLERPCSTQDNKDDVSTTNSKHQRACVSADGLDSAFSDSRTIDIADSILFIERSHASSLLSLDYSHPRAQSNVTHVYNPLGYASVPHSKFVKQYGNSKRKILFMGMNPGPYGMAQTGVRYTYIIPNTCTKT